MARAAPRRPAPSARGTALKLSVCIPTHHGRCPYLEQALESIAAQASQARPAELEIVVSDNASRDGTDAMIDRFRAAHSQLDIVYVRNDRDVRLANILRVVERASGDWCWLFGSDDIMAGDGLALVVPTIQRFPQASGLGFGKANFSHDMSRRLAQDAAEFYPDARETTLYEGYERVIAQVGFQHAFMGTNVVRRDRWLAAAARVGEAAVRDHPDWPQLMVFAEVVRADPSWVWLAATLVKARAGRPYLVERDAGAPNLARMHAVLADGLRRAWPQIAGRETPLHRALVRKSYAVMAGGDVVRNIRLSPDQTLARDARLLWSFTRMFWRLPEFRRECLPLLLVPTAVERVHRRLRPGRAAMMPLAPAEIATDLQASLAQAVRPRETLSLRLVLTNRGSRPLRWRQPHPVAIGYRWFDAASGTIVLDGDRTPLPRALATGESVQLDGRVSAPWDAGRYELRIAPVQELVAWFDDVDPANGTRIDVDVGARPVSGGGVRD